MTDSEKIEALCARLSPSRVALMRRALEWRTRRLTVVLEDVFQSHNASAVLRTCDALGIQEAHIIENRNRFVPSRNVDMGASKWMDIRRYALPSARKRRSNEPRELEIGEDCLDNTRAALEGLRARGFLLAASTLRLGAADISEVPVDRPVSVMIGTELTGLTRAAHDMADILFSLPMLGFVQSMNLSVFSALCLSSLAGRMRAHSEEWRLSRGERDELMLDWLGRCVADAREWAPPRARESSV